MVALLTETRAWTKRLHEELNQQEAEELRQQKGERIRRRLLRQLAWQADALAGVMLAAWKWIQDTLEEEGFEGRELVGYCEVLLEGINEGLTGHDRLLALAREAALTPEAIGLRDLEAKLPALREARPKVAELLALATRPPRPVDEKVLAESSAALARGEFVTINDEYLRRIQAGEDF
jgi:hypothetical protein